MIVVLGGTSDARLVTRKLLELGLEVTLCVLTEHAGDLAQSDLSAWEGRVGIRVGALDQEALLALVHDAAVLVDATHPFATKISALAQDCCTKAIVPYVRFEREKVELPKGAIVAPDAETAASRCVREGGQGAIFATVGTRTLDVYVQAARQAGRRLVARVLPTLESLSRCRALGIDPEDIVALQGPSNAALDCALLRRFGATVMVMKESGHEGGLTEKLKACRLAGATAVVVARPPTPAEKGATVQDLQALLGVLAELGIREAGASARRPPERLSRPGRTRCSGVKAGSLVSPSVQKARVLMIVGTGSHVGKTVLVAALCRFYARRGLRVAPFKAQNMALNSYVTREGGEIGRAQAFQAEAAGIEPHVDMNPVLLKPASSVGSQVVVLGRPVGNMLVHEYHSYQREVWPLVGAALDRLRASYDLVIIEGAGGVAEVNLREQDIVNMKVARYCDAPTLLVGDIDRGGVFASLYGSVELLDHPDRTLIKGFVINKFRGDPSLLRSGIEFLEQRTGVPVLGVVPYMEDWSGDEEDSLGLEGRGSRSCWPRNDDLRVAVVRFPFISNYTDFAPLEVEQGVCLRYVSSPGELAGAHLIILPGTKSTLADLRWLKASGLAEQIRQAVDRRTPVIGICGGYQMLGLSIDDPLQVESDERRASGLGLLDIRTTFSRDKRTVRVRGELTGAALGQARTPMVGYEIHMGRTERIGGCRPLLKLWEEGGAVHPDGAVCSSGLVTGTYVHGLFDHPALRAEVLRWAREAVGLPPAERASLSVGAGHTPASREQVIDRLCDHVQAHLDMEALDRIVWAGKT